ncbi:hypothetical protein ACIP6X_34875 [Streptomyces coeruleorubidus]|jgi:hypothetical protein|uniref:hypothetical protein n=1 Tax=Streptomyces coeruleorubidus TaxID=116188 RepID=UPI0038188344
MSLPGAVRTLGSLYVAQAFEEIVQMQRAADEAHTAVEQLQDQHGPPTQMEWTDEQRTWPPSRIMRRSKEPRATRLRRR